MAHPPHLLPSAANCHAIHRRGPCGHAAATFSGMRSSVGRVGRAEFDKLVTFRIGSVRRSDGRTDGVLLTAALKCTITMRSSVRRNNIGLSVVRAVARFVADQHRRRIDFSSLSFFSWIHNHQHMRASALGRPSFCWTKVPSLIGGGMPRRCRNVPRREKCRWVLRLNELQKNEVFIFICLFDCVCVCVCEANANAYDSLWEKR